MKVIISDMGSSLMFVIETKKYRRTMMVSKQFPRLPKLIDSKYVYETQKAYRKFRNEWIEAKQLRELIDTGDIKEYIRNSPKQQEYRG